jgi:hypothetical protein
VIVIVWLTLILLTALAAYLYIHRNPIQLHWIVGAAAAVFFILAALLGYREIVRLEWYQATMSWPAVTGKVISTEVAGKRAFVPKIRYSYPVGDSVYSGITDLEVPGFGTRSNRLDVAEKSVADYAPDSPVTVHYNPANPSISRLKVSAPWNVYMRLSTAVFGSLLSTALFLVFLAGRWKKRSQEKSGH